MTKICFLKWTLLVDAEATRQAYAQVEDGFPERCGCDTCQNLIVQRERLYPDALRNDLECLGVDWRKEAEAYHLGPVGSGAHGYAGWFHVVGTIIAGPEQAVAVRDSEDGALSETCTVEVTRSLALVPKCFPTNGVLQIEWANTLPWIIALDEPIE